MFTAPSGGPVRNGNLRCDVYDRVAASVGLTGLNTHDLRHSAARLAVAAGANIKAGQQMRCGWGPPTTTHTAMQRVVGDDRRTVVAAAHDHGRVVTTHPLAQPVDGAVARRRVDQRELDRRAAAVEDQHPLEISTHV